eukprot:scaffold14529_cov117-Isochrysis_galbana.AAC.6
MLQRGRRRGGGTCEEQQQRIQVRGGHADSLFARCPDPPLAKRQRALEQMQAPGRGGVGGSERPRRG